MLGPHRSQALDHAVVVMFENRLFDNLLGRLYEPGEVRSFEGVSGRDLSDPIPEWPEHGASRGYVPYGVAPNMDTPYPDPGDNAPADPGQTATMDGFVTDYITGAEGVRRHARGVRPHVPQPRRRALAARGDGRPLRPEQA